MSLGQYVQKWKQTYYREFRYNTPMESFSRDGSKAVRILPTEWELRDQATIDFLGRCGTTQFGEYLYPSRDIPHYHPKYMFNPLEGEPDLFLPYLFAVSLDHVPRFPNGDTPKETEVSDSDGGQPGNFLESWMKVGYEAPPFNILTDNQLEFFNEGEGVAAPRYNEATLMRYVFGKQISSPKYQTIPRTDGVAWGYDNQPLTVQAVVMLSEGDLILKWYDVNPAVYDEERVRGMVGKSNRDDFGSSLSPIGKYAAGTLVFQLPDKEWFRRATGEIYLDLTYRFRYFPNGANYFYRSDLDATGDDNNGEEDTGPGFYFAARRDPVAGIVHPDGDEFYTTNPGMLIHAPDDFTDLFRKKV